MKLHNTAEYFWESVSNFLSLQARKKIKTDELKCPAVLHNFSLNKLFIIRQSSSPKTKVLQMFFRARGQKIVITCHICTRFDAYLHSRMLGRITIISIT